LKRKYEDNIYYGFKIEKNDEDGISNNPEYERVRKFLESINQNYSLNSEWWLGWKYPKTQLDFRTFNSEAIFNLADTKFLEEQVDEIVQSSIKDIELMKTQLTQLT